MTVLEIPLWLRIILLIPAIISFIPQLWRLHREQNSKGISLAYLLFNAISAAEQFTLCFFLVVTVDDSDSFTNKPPNAGDWVNIVQETVVWILSSTLFAAGVYYSPATSCCKLTIVTIYLAFLLVSIVPLFVDAATGFFSEDGHPNIQNWGLILYSALHSVLICPAVSFVAVLALPVQARAISKHRSSALSLSGLAVQAVVFMVLAITWIYRVVFPYDVIDHWTWNIWYRVVGWAAVDTGIFAFVQAALFGLLLRRRREIEMLDGESEPLLAG